MFFIISKSIGGLLVPSNFLIATGFVGLILICSRFRSLGRKLLIVCVAGFLVFGFSPAGSLLLLSLETRFPVWKPTSGAPDGIVVLGGGMERVVAAAQLAHQYPKARVVYSGGNSNLIRTADTESDVAESILVGLGLPRDQLYFDRQSRNTLENAQFSKAIAAPKTGERWLLVTSAYHMPRSVGIFRKVGFALEPYPVDDFRKRDWPGLLTLHSSFWERIEITDISVREWMGLIAYRLAGRTAELLPSPEEEN
jgi:uncharacterized SAM-binding protein YcdF (DUF218 family)